MTEINPLGKNPQNKPAVSKECAVKPKLNESLFLKLDKNKDGKISNQELYECGFRGNDLLAMSEVLFFAERDVNKWFMKDKNHNGVTDSAEEKMWDIHNTDGSHKIGDLKPEEFAKKYNLEIQIFNDDDFTSWCKSWMEDESPMRGLKAIAKERYGKELTDDEVQLLYEAMKNQANRWLFKTPALYNRLNTSAYTRLVTGNSAYSCCGGDIAKPPMGAQPKLDENGELMEADSCEIIFTDLETEGASNSAHQTKNRLAWAAFKTIPEKEAAKLTAEEYAKYQSDWNNLRAMKASDFRDLLKPENKDKLEKFEENSNMTVRQIVDWIDIVESATGKDFDNNDWEIDPEMFHNDIMQKVNGTYGDDKILEGKTRSDVPLEKQELLKYLEEHGLLLEQFRE